jgi:hypothetical protein
MARIAAAHKMVCQHLSRRPLHRAPRRRLPRRAADDGVRRASDIEGRAPVPVAVLRELEIIALAMKSHGQ